MKHKLLIFLLVIISISASAQGVIVKGGSIDCGKWLTARKTNTANYYEYYLLGIVDGLALGRAVDIWTGKNGRITSEQFYYWLDSYCEKNPLNMTITGAFNFADEMTAGEFNSKARR